MAWANSITRAIPIVLRHQYSHRPARACAGEGSKSFSRTPVFRIARVASSRWTVERPDGAVEPAFPTLEQAVAFVRHESQDALATIELRIGELYVVAQLDPHRPGSLFGEPAS